MSQAKPLPVERPSQRVQQREDTRKGLLAAARELFTDGGVEQVAMDRISSAAGVSRATLYLHFSGKPALLEALLIEDWAGQVRLFERLGTVDFFAEGQLERWLSRVVEGMRQARHSFAIHRAALGQNPELTERHYHHRARLAQLLLEAAGGRFEPADVILAELIVAEVEYFATAAAITWTARQFATALPIIAARLREFARSESELGRESH